MATIFRAEISGCVRHLVVFVVSSCCLFNQALAQTQGDKRIALVIGNSNYPSAPLRNPRNDANTMASTLAGLGFEVKTLLDQRRVDMLREVRGFSERLKTEKTVGLLYFAGHGMQARGKNFVIPVDADIRTEDEIEEQGIDLQFIVDRMGSAGSSSLILILDACRNNPFVAKGLRNASGLAAIDGPPGTLVAFSAAPGKVAFDGEGDNSPYTKRVAEALSTPGIPVEEVFKRVRVGVLKDTSDKQVPWENTALTRDFYFKPVEPGSAKVASVLAPLEEDRYWAEIKESRSIYDFLAYSRKFPSTEKVNLLLERINEILKFGGYPSIRLTELPIFIGTELYAGFEFRHLTKYTAEYYGLPTPKGYLVSDIYKNSVSDRAGLKPGDIVLKVNNVEYPHVTSQRQLRDLSANLRPGEYVVAVVWRDRKEVTLSGIIERAPLEFMVRETAYSLLTEKKAARAAELLAPLAERGDIRAKSLLGLMMITGNSIPKDLPRGAKLIKEAAESGGRFAAYLLGIGYFQGLGIEKNDVEAFRWLKFAGDGGLPEAMGSLSALYFAGRGTPQDLTKAYQLANISANQGVVDGMLVLGLMHEQGTGVSKDSELAREWFQKAADLNSSGAKAALKRLDGK